MSWRSRDRDTYAGNAIVKALAWAMALGRSALADDSGLEVRALGWGPGDVGPSPPTTGQGSNGSSKG